MLPVKNIWFFDADDLVFVDSVRHIVEYLQQDPDILRFSSVTQDSNTAPIINTYNNSMSANIIYRGRYGEYLATNNIGFACWGVIVKRRLLEDKKVLFDVGLSISEDVVWNLSLAYHCPDADFMVTDLRVVKYIVNAKVSLYDITLVIKDV